MTLPGRIDPTVSPSATQRAGRIVATTLRTGRVHLAMEFAPGHDWRTADLTLDDRGRAILDVLCLVVQTPDAVILVDPSEWDRSVHDERFDVDFLPGASLDDGLAEQGLTADDVTHVVLTHLHPDHVNGIAREQGRAMRPRFRNATHLVPGDDWQEVGETPWLRAIVGPYIDAVDHAGLIDYVTGDVEVVRDVWTLAAPGESPGHQVLRISADERTLYFLGDLFHITEEFRYPGWGPAHATPRSLADSRRRVLSEAQARTSLAVFSHARYPGWGSVRRAGRGWTFLYQGERASR